MKYYEILLNSTIKFNEICIDNKGIQFFYFALKIILGISILTGIITNQKIISNYFNFNNIAGSNIK